MKEDKRQMIVRSHMTLAPETVAPNDSLASAQAKMHSRRIRQLPVVENGVTIGMLTDRDIRQHIGFLRQTKVNATMSSRVISVAPENTLEEAAQLILEHKIGGLPVIEAGKLVGIISTSDLLAAFLALTGAHEEESIRIDLASDGNEPDLTDACNIVRREGGRTLSVGTYADRIGDSRVFYARIRASDPAQIARALAQSGYEVLDVRR